MKLSASVDAKEAVLHFYSKLGKKADKKIGGYIKQAKALLEDYSLEEIIYAMNKCFDNPPPGGIYSFGFISYNIKKIIDPVRKDKAAKEVQSAEAANKDFGSLPGRSENSNKLKRFGNKKEIDWDV